MTEPSETVEDASGGREGAVQETILIPLPGQ